MKDVIICPCIDDEYNTVFYLDGSMSSAIGVEQRQGDQL